jgi:calcineurin-like phosphoesterase family protein
MILFTSDTHLADPRVLKIDRRPFQNMGEHDAAVIANWNATVQPDDEVWHLGDFIGKAAGDCGLVLERLNGTKHLIIGNNDPDSVILCGG